jgi:CheY-like chemotaxis protein
LSERSWSLSYYLEFFDFIVHKWTDAPWAHVLLVNTVMKNPRLPIGSLRPLTVPPEALAAAQVATGSDRMLEGLRILIVEDQVLIAIDMEETVRSLGARDVRLSLNAADALIAIEDFRPDAAVLDFSLGNETAVDAADELMRRSIPFIFATGYDDSVMIPERLRAIDVLRKPISPEALAEGLAFLTRNL